MANGDPGSLGTPMPFVDVKLVDENGREAKDSQEGEILLSGPHMCQGYLNKPDATQKAIQDGWFHTGDLGKMNSKGHFTIVGRKKDMIISGGVNIYPAEIERIVEKHPAVAGAAVIGVADPKWGEVGKAVLELNPGHDLNLEELNNYLNSKLGKFKLPKYLAVVQELPRTPASGKIQKFKLKEEHGLPDNG
jgi:fatty-acyl-CoA synthase